MSNIKELIASSLSYEKAFTMAEAAQRKASNGKAAALPEGDGARILIDDLEKLKGNYRAKAEESWAKVKGAARVSDEPFQNLANAIVERAVLDYEIALSNGDKDTQASIEKFAAGDFCYTLTKLDITEQLETIKERAGKFFESVQKNYKEISADSAKLRKAGKPLERFAKYRCPLCGGRIFEAARARSKRREYHCSGCALIGYEPAEALKKYGQKGAKT